MTAPSTIAFSAWNLVVAAGGPLSVARLQQALEDTGTSVSAADLEAALVAGERRGLFRRRGDTFDVTDRHRRRVQVRSRYGEGWDGWGTLPETGLGRLTQVLLLPSGLLISASDHARMGAP